MSTQLYLMLNWYQWGLGNDCILAQNIVHILGAVMYAGVENALYLDELRPGQALPVIQTLVHSADGEDAAIYGGSKVRFIEGFSVS